MVSLYCTVKPPIKGHSERSPTKYKPKILLYTQSIENQPLKEDNLSTKDKTAGPKMTLRGSTVLNINCKTRFEDQIFQFS